MFISKTMLEHCIIQAASRCPVFTTRIIDNVSTFDARVLALDLRSKRFLTSEKKNVKVDSFAKWRSGDEGLFMSRLMAQKLLNFWCRTSAVSCRLGRFGKHPGTNPSFTASYRLNLAS